MKLSIPQIETLTALTSAVAVDAEKFTTVCFEVAKLESFPKDVAFLEISYADHDLLYELSFTLGELLGGEVTEGDLVLADGRRLRFFTETNIELNKL